MSRPALGCDYSTKAVHLALVAEADDVGRGIGWCAMVDLAHQGPALYVREIRDAVGRALDHACKEGLSCLCLYLEEPWARADKGIQTALALHRVAAFVEAVGWLSGLEVVRVAVPTWRSQLFGRQPRSAQAKAMSINYVKTVYGVETRDHNLADAICLGAWGQRTANLQEAARTA